MVDYSELKVLVALSNRQASEATKDYFKRKGSFCLSALSRPEALEHLKVSNYNLIMTDEKFSDLGGINFAQFIRLSSSALIFTRIILGLSEPKREIVFEARNAGIDKMILLPFTFASLEKSVREVVGDKRQFIMVSNYTGPDRRTKQTAGPRAAERRVKQEGIIPSAKVKAARQQ